jgi:hypothetical protein
MRKILFILIALFVSYHAKAQWFKTYNAGYYYNTSGQRISGIISFQPYFDLIYFKTNKDARSEKIKIKEIGSVVVKYGGLTGTDSLTVLTEDDKEKKRYFGEFLFATPTIRFYHKFLKTSSGGPQLTQSVTINSSARGSQPSFSPSFRVTNSPYYSSTRQLTMYQDANGNSTFELTKKNYIEVLSKAFADVPDLVQKIQNKEFKFKLLNEMMNWYRNKSQYKSN